MNKVIVPDSILVSERPVEEGAGCLLFFFYSDSGKECYLDVSRDYDRHELGEWVLNAAQVEP